jgi:hypothetical protein
MSEPLNRPELVQIVLELAVRLAEATDLEDEQRIMEDILVYAACYGMLTRQKPPEP